jgi:DNA-directed RNA polymerase specialized sigma24 family protein
MSPARILTANDVDPKLLGGRTVAIILKEYHGLTFQEIADLLDCPLSTVKTRLYQGLSVVRKQLQAAGVDGEALKR